MLYDILIIDDDFNLKGKPPSTGKNNANRLLSDLIRDNLRVTWTSGEDDDIEKLEEKDLSVVKYIICDLHLEGAGAFQGYKTINSKLIGIMDKLHSKFSGKNFPVTIYINSNCLDEYTSEGVAHFKSSLKKRFKNKFSVEVEATKNALTQDQKEELRQYSLGIYLKSMIINKEVEVERIFSDKLNLNDDKKIEMDFQEKYLIFQSKFLTKTKEHKRFKNQICLLQMSRNQIAHNDIRRNEIEIIDNKLREVFLEILEYSPCEFSRDVPFKNLETLSKYIKNIDMLIKELEKL